MIIVRTPLRISFVGGGSDIPAFYRRQKGRVVSSAIDKFVYVIVKSRFDEKIYINYSKKECVDRLDDVRHDLVREAMRITGVTGGVEITTLADIPSEGSGLGSSSSITVALLHALYAYNNELVTAERLAREACEIEIDILGKPIGRQDQYAAAYGGVNEFVFHEDDTVERRPVQLANHLFRKFSSSLLLYFTGLTRDANVILSEQVENTAREDRFTAMCRMVDMVPDFVAALNQGDIHACGALLQENWSLKRQMAAGISTPRIDAMAKKALEAGAIGAKIAGAGGGGFLVLLVPRDSQAAVFEAMEGFRELPFMLERSGSKVIFDNREYPTK
ncbi:MAG: GHMP kinase [Deltaproteobacteria bacterium]|nr:GHMP kinase [Deltaproteobacteria bacterium]